jgi:hypothetical protein
MDILFLFLFNQQFFTPLLLLRLIQVETIFSTSVNERPWILNTTPLNLQD